MWGQLGFWSILALPPHPFLCGPLFFLRYRGVCSTVFRFFSGLTVFRFSLFMCFWEEVSVLFFPPSLILQMYILFLHVVLLFFNFSDLAH